MDRAPAEPQVEVREIASPPCYCTPPLTAPRHPWHRQFGRAAFQRGILLYFVWLAAFTVSSFLYRHDHHAFNFNTVADGARVVADIIVVVLNV